MDNSKLNQMTIAEIFKQARSEQGLTLADVVNTLRIRYSHLEAIEKGDYKKLPERTYTLGYIVSYAKFLKLDPKFMVKKAEQEYEFDNPQYSNMVQNTRLDKQYNPFAIIKDNFIDFFFIIFSFGMKRYKASTPSNSHSNPKSKLGIIFVVILVIFVVIVGGWYFSYKKNKIVIQQDPTQINNNVAKDLNLNGGDGQANNQSSNRNNNSISEIISKDKVIVVDTPKQERSQTQSKMPIQDQSQVNNQNKDEVLPTTPNSNRNHTKVSENNTTSTTANGSTEESVTLTKFPITKLASVITLQFSAPVWIQIYNAKTPNQIYVDAIYKNGDVFKVPNVPNLSIDIGNYHGITILVNNKTLTLTGEKGTNVIKGLVLDPTTLVNKYSK